MVDVLAGVYFKDRKLADGSVRRHWYMRGRKGALPEPNSPKWFAVMATLAKPLAKPAQAREPTVADMWEDYKGSVYWPRAEGSQTVYESTWRNHISPSFGASTVASITIPLIVQLRDSRAAMPQTANMILAVLGNIWKRGVETGKASARTPDAVARLATDPDGARPLSPAAWSAMTSLAAPERIRRLAYLGRATGQRIGDLLTMTPAMREDGGIRHRIQKTGRRRGIASHWSPISAEHASVIDGWRSWPTRPYLHVGPLAFNDESIRREMAGYAASEAGKALQGYTPHDLRATCICDDRFAGFTELQIEDRRAISPEKIKLYTRHIDQKAAAEASGRRAEGA